MKSILGYQLEFNKYTSSDFSKMKEYDELRIKTVNNYCNDILRTIKYVSLETILKAIGIDHINPDDLDGTEVYRFNGHYLHFDYRWEGESMIVTICEDAGI